MQKIQCDFSFRYCANGRSFAFRSEEYYLCILLQALAHKFHGPKGIGILYINENVKIKPFIYGGSQERNMRAGTENIYGIVGFAKALEIATNNYEDERIHHCT